MPTELEYMQFATGVYAASQNNQIGVPDGWEQVDWVPDQYDGFSNNEWMSGGQAGIIY
jgi:hypothetical protein